MPHTTAPVVPEHAGELHLVISQWAVFSVPIQFKYKTTGLPVDLTAATDYRMHVRENVSSGTVLLELTLANGRIIVDDALNGKIRFLVLSAITGTLAKVLAVYDMFITFPTGPEKFLVGKVEVKPAVTHTP